MDSDCVNLWSYCSWGFLGLCWQVKDTDNFISLCWWIWWQRNKIKSLVKCYFGCSQGFHCKGTISFYFVITLLLLVKRKISKYILLFFIVVIDCRHLLTCVSDGLYQTCILWFGAEIARITCLILWKSGLLIPRYGVFLLEALCWYLSHSYWGVKVLWHWGWEKHWVWHTQSTEEPVWNDFFWHFGCFELQDMGKIMHQF